MSLAIETERGLASYLRPVSFGPIVERMEGGSRVSSIAEIIEKSKSHWSQLGEFDSDNEVAEVSNVEVFHRLQQHPTWGDFFRTFGEGEGSWGDLMMGEKFAEGGQAEIYEVQIKWFDPRWCEKNLKKSTEWVLKVFKKGTSLRHLQSQWPQGMLQHQADKRNRRQLGLPQLLLMHCDVYAGTLLEDGRFAFVMVKEREDLRSMLDRRLLTSPNDIGPLSRSEALEAMYQVALGMDILHNRGIVHRDIKASNVLVSKTRVCYIADFECSIGVVGTGFFKAPEILEACKQGNEDTKVELFTKAVDIYSYGMTCYEIWTGKLPFEGHLGNVYELVLEGQRPKLPNYVDGWIRKLLNRCWASNPIERPSSQEILNILLANSKICRREDLEIQKHEAKFGRRKVVVKSSKIVEMWSSLKWRLPKLKMP